jgi:hypothetical protein
MDAGLGLVDHPLGLGEVHPAPHIGGLAGFQLLVNVEEVADLRGQVGRHVRQVADAVHPRVVRRDREHLRVGPVLVVHPEHRNRPRIDQAPGERRLLEPHQRVERIPVFGEGPGDKPVVKRISRGGK